MKIVGLSTYHAAPRWLSLKVEADAGISGWAEPVIEGRAAGDPRTAPAGSRPPAAALAQPGVAARRRQRGRVVVP